MVFAKELEMEAYIEPNIISCDTIEDLNFEKLFPLWSVETVKIEELYENKRSFIFAEPGYGKTTLLKEIQRRAEKEGKQSIYIDLKRISELDYDAFLKLMFETKNSEIKKIESICRSENFVNKVKEERIFCFDALDEVKTTDLAKVYSHIEKISTSFKEDTIIISARINRSEKYTEIIRRMNFKYYNILKFDKNQLQSFLEKNIYQNENAIKQDYKENLIKNILGIESAIILIPRYLSYILRLVEIKPEFFDKKITRSEIMERVLLEKISFVEEEYEERIQLRVFGKLALAMEINQTKEIKIDDFINFFEIIDSKVCERIYYNKSTQELYNETILKYNQGMISFENAEIQEYLAARELNLLTEPEASLFKIVTDNPTAIIFPYWKNTISYFVEINPDSLMDILKYDYRKDIDHKSSVTEILSFVDINKYSQDKQFDIALLVYHHYQKTVQWIPNAVESQIGKMLPVKFLLGELLKYKEYPETIDHFLIGNQLRLLESNIESTILRDLVCNDIKKILSEIVKVNKKSIVQRTALRILSKIGTPEDIELIYQDLNLEDELTKDVLIDVCCEELSNSELAINVFFNEITSKKRFFSELYRGIMNISQSEYLSLLLEKLLQEQGALNRLLEDASRDFHKSNKRSKILKPSDELLQVIKLTIKEIVNNPRSHYYVRRSEFFSELIRLFDKKKSIEFL